MRDDCNCSIGEFMSNLQQIESKHQFTDRISTLIKKYVGDYAYAAQLYIAFALATTSSPDTRHT